MSKKDKTVFNFIFKEIGIEISPMLESLIKNPKRLETLNNIALEQVVKEFAPIYRKYKYTLDAPHELEKIGIFTLFLCNRLNNKPELNKILNDI